MGPMNGQGVGVKTNGDGVLPLNGGIMMDGILVVVDGTVLGREERTMNGGHIQHHLLPLVGVRDTMPRDHGNLQATIVGVKGRVKVVKGRVAVDGVALSNGTILNLRRAGGPMNPRRASFTAFHVGSKLLSISVMDLTIANPRCSKGGNSLISCFRDLFTADALDEHVITFHVTCPHPGCDYSARPDLVINSTLYECLE